MAVKGLKADGPKFLFAKESISPAVVSHARVLNGSKIAIFAYG